MSEKLINMSMPVNERLKNFSKESFLKNSEVAYQVGTTHNTILQIFKGRNEPSCVILRGFADAFPMLNMNWVFRGEGEMEVGEEVTDGNLIEKVKHLEELLLEKERIIAEKERYILLLEKQGA